MTEHYRGGSPSIIQNDYWWYRVRSRLLSTVLEPFAGDAARVLDVGSADGPSVGWLRGRELHVSLDLDPRGLESGGVCGSALELPFRDGSFDIVSAFDVIEHCDPESGVVAELTRVLRPGGHLLVSVPAYQWAWSDFDEVNGHHRRYTRPRLVAALTDQGLAVQRSTYAFSSMFPLFVAERVVRRLRSARRSDGPREAADVVELPQTSRWMDRILMALGSFDARWLSRRDLPFGSSVVAAATRPRLNP